MLADNVTICLSALAEAVTAEAVDAFIVLIIVAHVLFAARALSLFLQDRQHSQYTSMLLLFIKVLFAPNYRSMVMFRRCGHDPSQNKRVDIPGSSISQKSAALSMETVIFLLKELPYPMGFELRSTFTVKVSSCSTTIISNSTCFFSNKIL